MPSADVRPRFTDQQPRGQLRQRQSRHHQHQQRPGDPHSQLSAAKPAAPPRYNLPGEHKFASTNPTNTRATTITGTQLSTGQRPCPFDNRSTGSPPKTRPYIEHGCPEDRDDYVNHTTVSTPSALGRLRVTTDPRRLSRRPGTTYPENTTQRSMRLTFALSRRSRRTKHAGDCRLQRAVRPNIHYIASLLSLFRVPPLVRPRP